MVARGWARLRPFDADLRWPVTVLTILVAACLTVGGGWAVIDLSRAGSSRDSVSYTIYLYLVIFGVLLSLGELGIPRGFYNYFGFLATSSGRAFFLLFASSLALSAGWSRNRSQISSIVLIVGGFSGIVVALMGLCYGSDHHDREDGGIAGATGNHARQQGGGGSAGGGSTIGKLFGRGAGEATDAQNTPESAI